MLTTSEIVRSVYGAWRLARLDPIGMEWLDRSPEGFWRSFRVALLVLPLEIATNVILLTQMEQHEPLARIVAVAGIAYVIAWTAFPVLSHPLVGALGRAERYPGYITAINWSRVIVYAVVVPVMLLTAQSPAGFATLLLIGFYAFFGVYQWFIAKTALDLGAGPAAGLTMMEIALLIVIDHVAVAMMTVAPPAT
jgi:hypothetical protein